MGIAVLAVVIAAVVLVMPLADLQPFGSRDPRLAGDRTALAWERTGLSMTGIAALLATAALHPQ